jgi:hypothetical protein
VHDGWRHGRWVHHESEDVASAQGKIRHDLRSCGILGFVGNAIWRFVEYTNVNSSRKLRSITCDEETWTADTGDRLAPEAAPLFQTRS